MIRASPLIPDMKKGLFRCNVCEQTALVEIDRGRIVEPRICPNEACKQADTMMLVHNRCEYASKQVCRVQETPD